MIVAFFPCHATTLGPKLPDDTRRALTKPRGTAVGVAESIIREIGGRKIPPARTLPALKQTSPQQSDQKHASAAPEGFPCLITAVHFLSTRGTRVPGQRSRGLESYLKCGRDAGSHQSIGLYEERLGYCENPLPIRF